MTNQDAPVPISPTPSSVPPDPKRKRKRLLLLLLLLLFLGGGGTATWVVVQRMKPPTYLLQGDTEIQAGNIVMKIWDSEAEDGDVIQVLFRDKLLADNLAILNTPVEYKLGWLAPGEYEIRVRPVSEGSNPPATAQISLSDGKTEKEFGMSASKEYAALWKVIVKDKIEAQPDVLAEIPTALEEVPAPVEEAPAPIEEVPVPAVEVPAPVEEVPAPVAP